jgi:hypothetical protein
MIPQGGLQLILRLMVKVECELGGTRRNRKRRLKTSLFFYEIVRIRPDLLEGPVVLKYPAALNLRESKICQIIPVRSPITLPREKRALCTLIMNYCFPPT